ncbi:S8 family serine peptidase [Dyadobacter sp. CY107]|uniref:S8 family peptidase n=1 Tax=Dyadobacter fanqingshengii TaxID=2906443 RepID=UPI001F4879A9|nr:S8 family serine peptidase [Dyadobacter fanqingshengii]MCF2502713.1 S8 family serine peptidase [Dyadobacter fanqingshengii]
MKDEHVILRLKRAISRDIYLGGAAVTGLQPLASELTVELDNLDKRRVSNIARSSDVIAFAPVMPMKLIEPLDVQDVAIPSAANVTWGIKAVGADQMSFTGNGIVVAVLDTGIDPAHAAFAGVELVQKDFTGEGDGDMHGHGTHCAGTIFGRNVNNTRIGVARGVTKALIGKVIGQNSGSSAGIVNAIQWASQNGAHVISMSLGIDFPGYVESLIDQGIPAALATSKALEAYRANVQLFEKMAQFIKVGSPFFQSTVLIAAAGNESRRDVNADFEIGVSPPAVSDGFISIAALGEDANGLFRIAPFSNTGAMISGPGVNVISARPGGGLTSMSGTSMATPHAAGVAALWAEKLRSSGNLNPLALTAKIIASGDSTNMEDGFDPFDVGTGMITAPKLIV